MSSDGSSRNRVPSGIAAASVAVDDFAATGPPILLLHGIPGWRGMWRNAARYLAADCRVISPDLLGFGESSEPSGEFHASGQADMVVQLIRQLGCGPVHLVGFDFGGPIAVLVYRQAPELVSSLTLAATNVFTVGFQVDETPSGDFTVTGAIWHYDGTAWTPMSLPSAVLTKETVNRAFETTLAEGVKFERRAVQFAFGVYRGVHGAAGVDDQYVPGFEKVTEIPEPGVDHATIAPVRDHQAHLVALKAPGFRRRVRRRARQPRADHHADRLEQHRAHVRLLAARPHGSCSSGAARGRGVTSP